MNFTPHPAESQANLRFSLKSSSNVRLMLYSLLGESKMEFDLGYRQAGEQLYSFDVSTLASGLYPVKIFAERETQSAFLHIIR